jgi:hypothetical protein
MDGIQFSLLDVVCLTSMQNVVARKHGKMITHCFWFKILSLDEDIQHFCHCFSSNFEGEMNYLVPLCVHERKCISKNQRNMKQKSCKVFNLLQINYK